MELEKEKKLFMAIIEIKNSLRDIKGSLIELEHKLEIEEKFSKMEYPAYEDYIAP